MSDIYVFSSNDNTNDYTTMGLVGALTPTECTFKETANGESIVELTHPIDTFGRYTALQRGNILAVPVPVRTTPEIHDGKCVTTVWTYKVKPLNQLTSTAQRTLYMWRFSSAPKVAVLNPGEEITVIYKANEEEPASGEEDIHPWKAKSKRGEGWIDPDALELVTTHSIEDDPAAIEEIQSPWTVTKQYFRIYETKKSLDEINVTARHISYDLLYNMTRYRMGYEASLQDILDGVLGNCYAEHQFSAYTTLDATQTGNWYDLRNPIDVFLNADDGLCARFGVDLIRDNYNLYFLKNPGINRGVRIQYGKNMTGVDFTSSEDEVATRIVPVGEKEDGTKLYLDDEIAFPGVLKYNSRGNTVKELQRRLVQLGYSVGSTGVDGIFEWRTENGLNAFKADANLPQDGIYDEATHEALMEALGISSQPYIDSEHINDYPIIHVYELKCENCTVGTQEDGGGKVTEEIARARMRQQVEDLLESGCDLPKIEMSVEFVNLGDTEEYKQFRNLENCFLYDYVIVQHPTMDIDVTAQIMEIEWDCLLDRMVSVEIGSVGKTLANTGITSWQIPNGFSGSKIAGGTIPGGALQSDIISVRHMQANSINTEALQAACVTAVKIAAGAIEANHISVEAIDAVLANIDTAVIEKAEIDWAEIASLAAEIANIAKAQITEANINQANINWANIANLSAAVAQIARAEIENAVITSAQIDDLAAAVAEIVHAEVGVGEFNLAEIKNLLANALILEQGSAGSMTITNLIVTQANMLGAVIKNLVIPGEDGKYYEIVVGTDGKLSTEEVTVTEGEIEAGELDDGRQIVTTTVNAESINGTSITAQQAILNTILTQALTAGQITAGEALIASATIPTLYTTSIEAIGNSLTFSANEKIQMIVSNLNGTTEDLTAYIAATNAELENLQGQIDGAITTWFYEVAPANSNPPASGWTTTEEKNIHLGDLYYDTITGYCYRWQVQNNLYGWQRITDTDVTKALSDAAAAQDTADSKRRVFVSTPVPPYDVGDLWTQGAAGEILRCQTAKTGQQSYAAGDWVKASKYTDDAKAEAVEAELETQVSILDGKIELRATKAEVEAVEKKIDGLEVGGTNLLRETRSFINWEVPSDSVDYVTTAKDAEDFTVATVSVSGATGNTWKRIASPEIAASSVKEKQFVVSVMCMVDDVDALEGMYPVIGVSGYVEDGSPWTRNVYKAVSTESSLTNQPELISGQWFKFCLYGSFTEDFLSNTDAQVPWADIAEFRVLLYLQRNGRIHWKQAKLEIGTVATDWSPAPQDTEPYVSDEPPDREPVTGRLWVDESEQPSVIRKWRGADVPTAREYTYDVYGRGKNLIPPPASAQTAGGVTYTPQSDGTIIASGTCSGTGSLTLYKGVLPPGEYTISGGAGGIQVILGVIDNRDYWVRTIVYSSNGVARTGVVDALSGSEAYHRVYLQPVSSLVGTEVDNIIISPQLEHGSAATGFEAYEDIPALSIDNAHGQIKSVAVEAGCDAAWKNLIDINNLTLTLNTASTIRKDQIRIYTTGNGGTWRGASTPRFLLRAGVAYTLSARLVTCVSGDARVSARRASDNVIINDLSLDFGDQPASMHKTYTPDADIEVYFTAFCSNSTVLTGDVTFRGIQLETGETATAYEAYKGLAGQESVKITACGKNLFDLSTLAPSHAGTAVETGENSVHVSTTGSGGVYRGANSEPFWIRKGVPYALSATLAEYGSGNARVGLRGADDDTFLDGAYVIFAAATGRLTAAFTPASDGRVYLSALCTDGTTLTGDCTFADIQLEAGNAATEYEPYHNMGGGEIRAGGNAADPNEIEYGGLYGPSEENPGAEWVTNTRLRTGYIPLPNALIDGVFKVNVIPSGLALTAAYMFDADKQMLGSSISNAVPGGYVRLVFRDAESSSAEIGNDMLEALRENLEVYVDALYGLPGAKDTVEISVDGDVLVTRRTGAMELNGTEDWTNGFTVTSVGGLHFTACSVNNIKSVPNDNTIPKILCSHYPAAAANRAWSYENPVIVQSNNDFNGKSVRFMTDSASLSEWKAYLAAQYAAGTPVTVVYELVEPVTEAMTAIAPITTEPGQINILTDADALTATLHGSGWETVNDTSGLRVDLSEVDDTLAALEEKFGTLGDTVAQHAEFIVSPDKIFAQVAEASKYNEQINALRVEIEANTDGITLRKNEIEAIGDRVSNIERGVHIDGSDIGLYSSDSPFETHVTHEGVVISENDMPTITVKENKMTSPRAHITDSLIFGADAAVAFRCVNGHFMMLRYGG